MFSFLIFENDERNNKVSCQYVNSPIIRHDNFNLPYNEIIPEKDFLNIINTLSRSKDYYEKYYKLDPKHQKQNIRRVNELFNEISVKGYQRATAVVEGTKYSIFKVHNRELSYIDNYFKQYKKQLELLDNYDNSLNEPRKTAKEEVKLPKVKKATATTSKKKRKVKRVNKFVLRRRIAAILAVTLVLGGVKGVSDVVNRINAKRALKSNEYHMNIDENNNDYLEKQGLEFREDDNTIRQISENIESNEKIAENGISTVEELNYDGILAIETGDITNTQTYIDCYDNNYDTIKKYADMYGIDPSLAMAIALQESSGIHRTEVSPGGGLGLYQIQVENGWNWDGKTVEAYNFETGEWEKYTIYKDNVREKDANVKAGMMLLQNCIFRNKGNIVKSIQEYNFGSYYTDRLISIAAAELGVDESYFDDYSHVEELVEVAKRHYSNYGDCKYLPHVLDGIPDGTPIKVKLKDGTEYTILFMNKTYHQDNVLGTNDQKSRS